MHMTCWHQVHYRLHLMIEILSEEVCYTCRTLTLWNFTEKKQKKILLLKTDYGRYKPRQQLAVHNLYLQPSHLVILFIQNKVRADFQ